MARVPVVAAGGIVLRRDKTPLIAVVRYASATNGFFPRASSMTARRRATPPSARCWKRPGTMFRCTNFWECWSMSSGGRSKVVHYWRMETSGGPSHELMDDVRAVDWLPLEAAVERLSRSYEQTFLAHVGPLALELARRPRAKQPARQRRSRHAVAAEAAREIPVWIRLCPGSAGAASPDARIDRSCHPAGRSPLHEDEVEDRGGLYCASGIRGGNRIRRRGIRGPRSGSSVRRGRRRRLRANASTWCRGCATGCGAPPDPAGNGFARNRCVLPCSTALSFSDLLCSGGAAWASPVFPALFLAVRFCMPVFLAGTPAASSAAA